jgi:bZIP factor
MNSTASDSSLAVPGSTSSRSETKTSEKEQGNHTNPVAIPPPNGSRSYAVAIYPYMAEQEDEFDVVV